MKFTMMALTLGVTLGGSATWADPPKTIRVSETVEIKAPIDKVWATVRDFDSLNKWHPGFASDELVSGGNGGRCGEKTHHQGRPDIHRKAARVRRGASFLSLQDH